MVVSSNVVLFLPGVQPTCAALNRERPTWGELDEMEESMKGKHSPPGAGNIYAKANEVIV
jgi:hypothetical protein